MVGLGAIGGLVNGVAGALAAYGYDQAYQNTLDEN